MIASETADQFEGHVQRCDICGTGKNMMCPAGYVLMERFIDELYYAMVGAPRRKGQEN